MKNLLRQIPKVDEIIKHKRWAELELKYPKSTLKNSLRLCLDEIRKDILATRITTIPSIEDMLEKVESYSRLEISPNLKRVINATGIIIHTNLGRSLLADNAIEAIKNVALHYSNLEYDLESGTRGSRYNHCIKIIKRLTNAEDALVVNNNAAAVMLVLNTLAEGKEVIISRGELIEIGGSFRIPDVMKKSGAILKEVGTTNRTYIKDYENAISSLTGLFMKAHTSNYVIKGFVAQIKTEDLVAIGNKYNIPTYLDAGSGLMFPFLGSEATGEPCIRDEIKKGIDIISFSGDKLLGGTQAGIIIGKKTFIEQCKSNPLTRALRPDKFTLAGLESTLILYLDEKKAKESIPTLKMILEDDRTLKRRALVLAKRLKKHNLPIYVDVIPTYSEVGGGSFPDVKLPSYAFTIIPEDIPLGVFEEKLRQLNTPIIARIEKERLIFDVRTVLKKDEEDLIRGIIKASSPN
ncbi:MAG TPA: L-seryl-tRNA(Sec) selenium transferase [Syntrophorhabdaceae bacterium]|nr:L-seryl-tRNA(Sec) selenium transferase [Syntrophorhabdaceae bacterium]